MACRDLTNVEIRNSYWTSCDGQQSWPALQRRIRDLLDPLTQQLGWSPKDGENALISQLRGELLGALGTIGDDRATQEEEFSIELRTRDRERKLIKKIDQTIERLDQEDYGYCDTCGVEIGLRRLEARPTATQCVDCKSLAEIKERQLRG